MSTYRPEIDADQLAQARGCEPWNDCYSDCADVARRDLDRWDDLDDAERERILGLVEWINKQVWS